MPFTIDGLHVPMHDWQANAIKDGGFQNFTGYIPEDTLRRHPTQIAQGAVLTGFSDSESVVWEGPVDADPEPDRGLVKITATGHMGRARAAVGRRLYLVRDYSLIQDGGDEPMLFTPVNDNIEAEVRESQLFFRAFVDETYTINQAHPLAMWAPGALITSYAYDIIKSGNTNDFELRMQSFTGPSGSRTNLEDIALTAGGPGSRDVAISVPEDGLVWNLRNVTGSAPTANRKVRLQNMRIRGLATTDNFRSDQVIADVGSALGYDISGVKTSVLDVMPLDWTQGSWLDLMLYISGLEDRRVLVREDRGSGPFLDYDGWDTTWKIRRARDGSPELEALPVYNRVIVHYSDPAGTPLQVTVDVSVPELALRGITNVWEESLSDPQLDSTLAQTVANYLAERYSTKRYAGKVDIIGATSDSGRPVPPFEVLPGGVVNASDFGPDDAKILRIHEVQYRPTGATLGLESPVSIDGLVALYGLQLARA
jgi:hypothetical protein